MVVGTVSYMAPEQALGRPVDYRADLFSFGVVLFELLTGQMPFDGTTPTEIIDHILHATPPPASRYTSGVPPALDALVARALEKEPAFRYQSAREMHATTCATSATASTRRRAARPAASPRHCRPGAIENSVAVMTFANITREPEDDWIGTGIAETVSSDLKTIHGLTIIGRARVFDALRNLTTEAHLKDSLAIDVGRRLGATWVVVGGFQRMAAVGPDHRQLRRGRDRGRCGGPSRWTGASATSSGCRTRSSST